MRDDYLEPAWTVVRILGGIGDTAKAATVHRSRVNRWLLPKEQGGTGGLIPSRHHQPLLDWAKENGKPLKQKHFFLSPEKAQTRRRVPHHAAA